MATVGYPPATSRVSRATPAGPLWKRLGRLARRMVFRLATLIERATSGRNRPLLPPLHLRVYYYGTWNLEVFTRACEGARRELISRGLRPEHRVLDIGSGIGNLAISLTDYLHGGYEGLDIHREAVEWCQRAITPQHPTFRFHHADLASRAYNARGQGSASTYRFPFPDKSFDFIFLGSVFTHLLPDAVEGYVREIARLLAPAGVCVASYFLLNDETRLGVAANRSFMSFHVPHPSGLCRLHDTTLPEAAIALEETFVRRIHERAGLRIRDVRRGAWWNGARHHQDILTAVLHDQDLGREEKRAAPVT